MTTAFQDVAVAFQFSPLAFQIDGGSGNDAAFQCGAFQYNAFQTGDSCTSDGAEPRLGGLHKHWGKRHWRDETPEEQYVRRLASGLIEPARAVVRHAAAKVANDEQVGKELEQEFYLAASVQYENEQLLAQIWAFELQRIQDDEDAAVILLL